MKNIYILTYRIVNIRYNFIALSLLGRFLLCTFACLLGFNIAFKYPRSCCDSNCLKQWYSDLCAAKQECHGADKVHGIPPCNIVQTQPTCRCATHFDVFGQTGTIYSETSFERSPDNVYLNINIDFYP